MPNLHKVISRMRKDLKALRDGLSDELKKIDKSIGRSLESARDSEQLRADLKSIEEAVGQLGHTVGLYLHRLSDRAVSRGVQIATLTSLFHNGIKSGSDQAKASREEKKRSKLDKAIKKAAKKAKKTEKKAKPAPAKSKTK